MRVFADGVCCVGSKSFLVPVPSPSLRAGWGFDSCTIPYMPTKTHTSTMMRESPEPTLVFVHRAGDRSRIPHLMKGLVRVSMAHHLTEE